VFCKLSNPEHKDSEYWSDEANRLVFLNSFPGQEVYEFFAMKVFLIETVDRVLGLHDEEASDTIAFGICPDGVAKVVGPEDYRDWEDIMPELDQAPYWTNDLPNFFQTHQLDIGDFADPFDDRRLPASLKPLVDQVIGKDDNCAKCGLVGGLSLFSSSNFHYIPDSLIPQATVCRLLPGNLARNIQETSALAQYIKQNDFTVERILNDLANATPTTKDPYPGWSADDWLCLECLVTMIKVRLMNWWLAEKVKGNVPGALPIKEDCWYGDECRTMIHNPTHAAKLNHLCENTYRGQKGDRRGDAGAVTSATSAAVAAPILHPPLIDAESDEDPGSSGSRTEDEDE